MNMKNSKALEWITANMDIHEFKDDESTEQEMAEWYAFEMEQFHNELEPDKPFEQWVKENYKVKTFFEDHEKVANKYYGIEN